MSAVKKTSGKPRVGDGTPGPGRPLGVPNKATKALKEMILEALDRKGGVEYLEKQAGENPTAFMTLIGKVLPMQVTGEGGGPIQIQRIELVAPQLSADGKIDIIVGSPE